MLREENKRLHQRFFQEVVNARNLVLLNELFAPDYSERDELKRFLCDLLSAFPDVRIDLDYQVAEMDRVVSCIALRGTQMACFRGIEPLGQRVLYPLVEVARFRNKRCIERWGGLNPHTLVRQLENSRTIASTSYPLAYTDRWALRYRQPARQ